MVKTDKVIMFAIKVFLSEMLNGILNIEERALWKNHRETI